MKEDFYYKPKYNKVSLNECIDTTAYDSIVADIDSNILLSTVEKQYLKLLATRQLIFRYDKLADYYASSNSAMKEYLEKLHAVIVDTDKAIQRGYFKYFEDYDKLISEIVDEK